VKTMKTRPKRLTQELCDDSKTLRYEFEMLIGTSQLCGTFANTVVNNAIMESFALHCRALIQFFFGHLAYLTGTRGKPIGMSTRDNDVLAVDYVPTWQARCITAPVELADAKPQADKEIAHITIERRNVNQPGTGITSNWKIADAVEALRATMEDFLSQAPPGVVDPDAVQAMRELAGSNARVASTATSGKPTVVVHPGRPTNSP
jgi:hypothetical protein